MADENATTLAPVKLHRNHGKICKGGCQKPLKTGSIRGNGLYCAGHKCRKVAEAAGDVSKRPRVLSAPDAYRHPQAAMLEGLRFASGGGPRQRGAPQHADDAVAMLSAWPAVLFDRMRFYEQALAAERGFDADDEEQLDTMRSQMVAMHDLVWPASPARAR